MDEQPEQKQFDGKAHWFWIAVNSIAWGLFLFVNFWLSPDGWFQPLWLDALILAFFQWLVFRHFLRDAWLWIPLTALGVLPVLVYSALASDYLRTPNSGITDFTLPIFFLGVNIPQFILFHRSGKNGFVWMLNKGVTLVLLVPLMILPGMIFIYGSYDWNQLTRAYNAGIFGLLAGFVYGIFSGIGLRIIFNRLPKKHPTLAPTS